MIRTSGYAPVFRADDREFISVLNIQSLREDAEKVGVDIANLCRWELVRVAKVEVTEVQS